MLKLSIVLALLRCRLFQIFLQMGLNYLLFLPGDVVTAIIAVSVCACSPEVWWQRHIKRTTQSELEDVQ